MRAASLALVLILAKVLGVAERELPASLWLPSVLFWDDIAAGCAFWLVDSWLGRRRSMWVPYWAVVTWAALNVPVTRALASPLSPNMLAATGGPLLDSITHYLTWSNLVVVSLVFVAALVLPRWLSRVSSTVVTCLASAAVVLALPGPALTSGIDIRGLQRNALTTLVATSFPRGATGAAIMDWRASPIGEEATPLPDLTSWRRAAAGRNVVLVVLESTAARYLRSYGAAEDPTPNLTTLSRQAIQFDRAYAAYPESIKGLFATLCSRVPAFDVSAQAHATAACTPLAAVLSGAGYRTGLFHSGRFGYLGMDAVVSGQGFQTLEDAGVIGGHVQSSFGVDEPSTVARILSWIDRGDERHPFFVAYLPAAGHHPYATNSPGPFEGDGDLTAYRNALFEGDRSLGLLLDGLRARGLDRKTLFVVMGDHGEAFGQHDGNFGHSLFIYDENVRVPLVIAMPGLTMDRTASPRVASAIDVDYSLGLLGLQDDCWKYQLEIDAGRSRLFDTCADPWETVDRSEAQPDRVRAYRGRVLQWSSATRESILHAD
jgi:Sulfatase